VDRFLRVAGGVSARAASAAARSGLLLVNDRAVPSLEYFVKQGDSVTLRALPSTLRPSWVDWAARILYEDNALLAVDKPAGVQSTPGPGEGGSALAAVEALLRGRVGSENVTLYPLHRLDKETSGVLCLARSPAVADAVGRLFRSRAVEKQYWALLGRAKAAGADAESEGEWRDLLAAPGGAAKRARVAPAAEGGKPCRTLWRRRSTLAGGVAEMELHPLTGRTHQLRVQAAARGTPVLGDALYGRADGRLPPPPRLCLHCARIALAHPVDGRRLELTAPLPAELVEYANAQRAAGPHLAS
jgi:RluA family pseudouridine synthase